MNLSVDPRIYPWFLHNYFDSTHEESSSSFAFPSNRVRAHQKLNKLLNYIQSFHEKILTLKCEFHKNHLTTCPISIKVLFKKNEKKKKKPRI